MKKYYKNFESFWSDLEIELSKYHQNDNVFIFRGQADTTWKLHSMFYRKFGDNNSSKLSQNLRNLLLFFEESLKTIKNFPNDINNTIELIEYARHFGLPVPLIDFTYSPYVALFFAVQEEFDKDAFLFIIDYKLLFKKYKEFIIRLKQSNKLAEYYEYVGTILEVDNKTLTPIIDYNLNNIDKFYFLKSKSFADFLLDILKYLYKKEILEFKLLLNKITEKEKFEKKLELILEENNPMNITLKLIFNFKIMYSENELFFIPYAKSFNHRMINQKGCFIYDTINYSKLNSFFENCKISDLETFMNYLDKHILKKILIPKRFKKDILKKLYNMNISGVSLFDDIEGAVIDAINKNSLGYTTSMIKSEFFEIDSDLIDFSSNVFSFNFLLKYLKDFSEA